MVASYNLKNPFSPFTALLRHHVLIVQMAKRDVVGRYRGSVIGLFWSFANPLFMLAVYTFVFGYIFKSRWTSQFSGHVDFSVILFAGLNIHTFFSDCANRSPTLIIQNTNFVKKVVFPLESLAWVTLGSSLFHTAISTTVLLVFEVVVLGHIPMTAFLFPIIVLSMIPFIVGTVWLLSSLGVFVRDLEQAITIITTIMLFLSPIFYPLSNLPQKYQLLMYLNPLTLIVQESRKVLIWGVEPDWYALALYIIFSLIYSWLSFVWFMKSKRGFADVL